MTKQEFETILNHQDLFGVFFGAAFFCKEDIILKYACIHVDWKVVCYKDISICSGSSVKEYGCFFIKGVDNTGEPVIITPVFKTNLREIVNEKSGSDEVDQKAHAPTIGEAW